jgi:hypothetical protein
MVILPWRTATDPDFAREYRCLATFLPLKRRRTGPRFFRYCLRVGAQLESSSGLFVGYSMRAAVLRHRFWTLSVWDGDASLAAFVAEHPHVDVMGHLSPHVGETRFVLWRVKGSEVPPSWETALARIAAG